jgi:hypothetical protein
MYNFFYTRLRDLSLSMLVENPKVWIIHHPTRIQSMTQRKVQGTQKMLVGYQKGLVWTKPLCFIHARGMRD